MATSLRLIVKRKARLDVGAMCAVALAVVLSCGAIEAPGAEIRLRSHAHPSGSLVVLGDVADIFAADPQQQERLRRIELFPAPPSGQTRFARAKEIQDLLALRGENLLDHIFSGASQVKITDGVDRGPADRDTGAVSFLRRRVERRLREAIARKLNGSDSTHGWRIEPDLSNQQVEQLNRLVGPLSVQRVGAGTTTEQIWRVAGVSGQPVDVRVQVTAAPRVVAVVHAVRRGATLHAEDVRLVPTETIDDTVFTSLDEVIGQETTQVLTAGQILTRDLLKRPTLVSRGQVVTVFSRTAGITVRATARAQEDGSLGDLIPVESLLDRQRFYARVSGVQEVEVYARSSRPASQTPVVSGGDRNTGGRFVHGQPAASYQSSAEISAGAATATGFRSGGSANLAAAPSEATANTSSGGRASSDFVATQTPTQGVAIHVPAASVASMHSPSSQTRLRPVARQHPLRSSPKNVSPAGSRATAAVSRQHQQQWKAVRKESPR